MSSRPAAELLAALAEVLRTRGTRWYLFGAQAVIIWGAPRMSADVDVTVDVEPQDSDGLVAAIESAGFELRIPNVEEFVARTRVLPFMHVGTNIPLDVVLAGQGLEQLFLDRAQVVNLAGTEIPMRCPDSQPEPISPRQGWRRS